MIRFLLPLLLLSLPLQAEPLYRCTGLSGEPLFANQPCGPDSESVALPEIGRIGSDDGGADLKRRSQALARIDTEPARHSGRAADTSGLTFGEEMTLRRLEIRRDGLERDVRNQALTENFRRQLREELALVKKRIRELEGRRR